MKTILLVGPKHCGKTTTMNFVYDKIKPQAEVLEPWEQLEEASTKDFRAVLKYKNKTIAFYSSGDRLGVVKKEIEKHKCRIDINIDILIICIRDFKRLGSLKNNQDHIFIKKEKKKESIPSLYKQANDKYCEKIIEMLNQVIISLTAGVSK